MDKRLLVLVTSLLTACGIGDYQYIYIGHGANLILYKGTTVVEGYILDHHSHTRYLTFTRLVKEKYVCTYKDQGTYNTSIITSDVKFGLIDKKTGKIFRTENRSEYVDYLNLHGIAGLVTSNNLEDASFISNKRLRKAFKASADNTREKLSRGECQLEKRI